MKIVTTTLLVSCLFAASGAQLFPCAPDCSVHPTSMLFPNPHDCTKYFQCASNLAVPRTCPDGLYFNPVIEVCDYPDSSGCTADPDYDCSASTTTVAPSNSTQSANTTVIFFTTEHPATSAAPNATSGGNATVVYSSTEVSITSSAPNATSAGNATVVYSTTEVSLTSTAPNVTSVTYVPSTTEVPITSAAPNVTVAESTTSRAYTSTEVPVTSFAPTTTDAKTTTALPTVSTTVSSGSTTDSGDCTPECPADEALFPNPRDCGSFYQCSFGQPFVIQCPDGQWYDAPNERCDYPELVECNAGPDAPCIAVTNPTNQPQETTTAVSGPTTTDGGEDCVPPCPSAEALYPNPRDCGSFYQCSFGVPHLMQCPPGQEYAGALERCDYPEVAECTAGPDSPCVAVTIPPQFLALRR